MTNVWQSIMVIASSLVGDMQALEQRGNNVEENIDNLLRLYSRYLQGKEKGLAVAFSGEWIYKSPAFASEENMIFPPDYAKYFSKEREQNRNPGRNEIICRNVAGGTARLCGQIKTFSLYLNAKFTKG